MLQIKNITVKNFMSVGNVTQAVHFDKHGLTLVLGNNIDLGGDGSRNGTGKTTIINALSYALYGNALYNIKKDNLVNKTNNKAMMVTVDFEKDGIQYRIERGRKPNTFRFLVNNQDTTEGITDEMQGEGRQSQQVIEQHLGMTHTMFKHIVALNTYTDPFLSMRANDQREMIEQLLGITKLSEKAEILKELSKNTRDKITEETYRIKGIEEANERINSSIKDLERRQTQWTIKRDQRLTESKQEIQVLEHIDIDKELKAHEDFASFNEKRGQIDTLNSEIAKLVTAIERETKRRDKAQQDLDHAKDHKCYACGQEIHDEQHDKIVSAKTEAVNECQTIIDEDEALLNDYRAGLKELGELGDAPRTEYNSLQEAYEHQNKIKELKYELTTAENEVNPYAEQIQSLQATGLQEVDWAEVNRLTELKEHQDFLMKLLTNKEWELFNW